MPRSASIILQVAVGVVFNHLHQVLVALRPAHNPCGGLWEFPGGKFESEESAFAALVRELREEIGIEVLSAQQLICVQHNYEEYCVELDTWIVTAFGGEPKSCEGQEIRWVNHTELLQLSFPEGNQKIVHIVAKLLKEKSEFESNKV